MIFSVTVKFHDDIFEIKNDRITVGIKSTPVKGQANKEVIKKISRHFGVPNMNVKILTGYKDREKKIEISGID